MSEDLLRLFVSSPGDVAEERQRVDLVVERLNAEFDQRVRIETIRWETSYYSAHDTFQKQIPEASDCDLVLAIFRARLGTPLPDGFPRLPTGEAYPSGTAYEVLTAIERRKVDKLPDVYVFRYPDSPAVSLDAPDRAEVELQWQRLKDFFDRWFRNKQGEFIAAFQNYATVDDFSNKLDDCLRQWLARRGYLSQGLVWDRLRGSPFPGLSAFEADRGRVFFGRDLAIAQAVNRLREAGADPKRLPFLLVIGPSGSGKSSLLRAGLMPRLTLPGAIPEIDLWRTAIVAPGPDPFASLAESLFADKALGPELRQGAFRTKEILAKQLTGDVDIAIAPLREALDKAAQSRKEHAKYESVRPARLALAIDQAERLFVEADVDVAKAFVRLVAELVRRRLAYLVFTLRSDAYARFQASEDLVALREAGETFDLVPPTSAELEEIVTRPVAACQPPLAFEQQPGSSLSAQLVVDAKGGDALPLLQMTLSRLYAAEAARGDGVLRFTDYRGMDAAVTETANEALGTLNDAAKAELPALITALVTDVAADPLTGAAQPIVTALDRKKFEAGNVAREALVEAFVSNRLLTAEGDGVSALVRPVHEALLRIWPQAVEIVHENAVLIRVRHTLEPIVREWLAAPAETKPRHLELSPALLDGAQQLLARFGGDLSPQTREFIAQAAAVDQARRDRERHEQEQRLRDAQQLAAANRRIARRTGVGLAAALVLAVVAGWQWQIAQRETVVAQAQTDVAQTQTKRAEQAAHEADTERDQAIAAGSRALAALADRRIIDGDATTGTLLALEAAEQHTTPEVEADLINGRLHLRELAVLPQPRGEVHASAISADSKFVITASSSKAEIWAAATGKRVIVLSGHDGDITDVKFSPDGTRVATGAKDKTARVWDVRTGKTIVVLKGHTDEITRVAFSPNGAWLLTASQDKTARLWDIASGTSLAVFTGHTAAVSDVAFSPSGALILTTSKDGTARLWSGRTGALVSKLTGHSAEVWQGEFSPDGSHVVTASLDGMAEIWDTVTGKMVQSLRGHADRVFAAHYIPGTDHIVTASYDQTARIWDASSGATLAVLAGHHGAVMTARPSADGRYIVTASTDRTARIWDARSGKEIATLAGHTNWVLDAMFSPDGSRILTAGRDRTARLWTDEAVTIETGQKADGKRIWRAAISPDGMRVAAPADNDTAKVWDARTGAVISVLRGHDGSVNAVRFDPGGQRVVTASSDGTARIWDAATGKSLRVLSGHKAGVIAAVFSPDGRRVLTGSADNTAKIWDADNGKILNTLSGHTGTVALVAFSPDGKRALTVSPIDETLRLWDAQTGKPLRGGIIWRGGVWGAAFSPDGKRIVLTFIDANVLDADTGDLVATYSGFGERVFDVAYSPDGRYLLLASYDGTARVWNAQTGRPVATLTGIGGGVWSIAISADGRRLMTASGAQTVQVRRMALSTDQLVGEIKPIVPRCLTPAERAGFNLSPAAPEWCFAMDKWPYNSRAWKIWHQHKDDKVKPPQPDSAEWLSWVEKTGSALLAKHPAEAILYAQEGASITEELSENDPENPRWRLALASNLIDEGRALKALGRFQEAIDTYERPLMIVSSEAAAHPDNAGDQGDVAYVSELVGDAFTDKHEPDGAVIFYRRALAIRVKLLAAEPDDPARQVNAAYDDQALAEQLLAKNANVEALGDARDNLTLRRKLADAKPGDADRAEDVAYALRLLGDVLAANDNAADARVAYSEALTIRKKLADAEPKNGLRLNAVAYVDERLAGSLLKEGKTTDAVALYKDAVDVERKAVTVEPDNVSRQDDLSYADEHLATTLTALGRANETPPYYREALAAREKVTARAERDEIAAQGKAGAATADKLGGVAWDALFAHDFDKALAVSRRAADLAPDLVWIKTNYAHALMFLNRTNDARAMYLEYRGKQTFKGVLWESSVLDDFSQFRRAGLVRPLMDEIEPQFRERAATPAAN